MVNASPAAGKGGDREVEWLKVGLEEGREGGVSGALLCGGLEVFSPCDAASWVFISESESLGRHFCVHAG
jgi:hypothetical protein